MTDTTTSAAAIASNETVLHVDPSVKARRRVAVVVAVSRLAIAALVLGAWELASGRLVSEFWVSSPMLVWEALVDLVRTGVLLPAVLVTLAETAAGFAVGAIAGILVGLVLGISPIVARILDPYLVGINSIPRVALIPLLILWFGIGFETKVIFAALLVFFPVFMNTFAGVRDVDRDLIDVIRVMGASRLETIRTVLVPSALAWVFAGLRVSIPFALIGAVIAEMFTSNAGLGYLIALTANQYNTSGSFAAILATTLLGLLLTGAVGLLERRLMRWRPREA